MHPYCLTSELKFFVRPSSAFPAARSPAQYINVWSIHRSKAVCTTSPNPVVRLRYINRTCQRYALVKIRSQNLHQQFLWIEFLWMFSSEIMIIMINARVQARNQGVRCMRSAYAPLASSGGASPSRQPGHFQVTKVVRQVTLPFPPLPSFPFRSCLLYTSPSPRD